MSATIHRLPIKARPIPIASDTGEPHTIALKALDMFIDYATKHCVPGWAEKAMSDRLWRIRARQLMDRKETV